MPKKAVKKAATKSTVRATAKKSVTRKAAQGGIYTTPRGNVSLMVPAFWTFRQTNDDLELDSPSDHSSVVVTAFKRDGSTRTLDSRDYMDRFLRTAPAKGRKNFTLSTKARTIARFKDMEGALWQVEFLTDGKTLLLATLNTTEPARSPEAGTATAILASLTLKKK